MGYGSFMVDSETTGLLMCLEQVDTRLKRPVN